MSKSKPFQGKRFKKKPKKFEIKVISRKEQRKALRKEKKSKNFTAKQNKTTAEQIPKKGDSPVKSKSILKKSTPDKKKKNVRFKNCSELQDDLRAREKQSRAQLEKDMVIARQKQLMEANQEEDRNIRQLAKLLKLNRRKTKSIPKSFKEDGLDYLLEMCDVDVSKDSNHPNIFEDDCDDLEENPMKRKLSEEEQPSKKTKKTNSLPVKNKDQTSDKLNSEEDDFDDDQFDFSDDENVEDSIDFGKDKVDTEADSDEDGEEEEGDGDEFGSDVAEGDDSVLGSDFEDEEDTVASDLGEDEDANLEPIPDMEEEVELLSGSDSDDDITKDDEVSLDDADDFNFSGEESEDEMEDQETARKNKALELPDGQWEDIYGRLRDKKGNIIQKQTSGKYIPPAMRAKLGEVDKDKEAELMRLRKIMKGLINRLAESNMHLISKQIEDIYMSHSRNATNEMLFKLFEEAIIAETLTPEKLVMEHAMLIAILHANVGTEVGAYFMQELIKNFDALYSTKSALIVENKKLDNVLYFLSHLYNFKIFHSCLLYDLVNQFCDHFSEKDIDLILVVLKSVGFSLRKDDPGALKQLIIKIQLCASKETQAAEGSRVKFMLDVLLAVKNNNFAKIPGYDSSHSERLKKLVKNVIRSGKYISELKITLDDLRNADERGRWWIVGSAWTGTMPQNLNDKSSKTDSEPQFSSKVLELARKQRMNTDTRRNVFCILMTAEDYLDAFERLLHLGLKGSQEQEILRVVIHCMLQEKEFNLYYAYLAQHFCESDRKYQINIQYTAWDKFKQLNDFSSTQLKNFAKFLAHLFIAKAVPISILKVLHFTDLDKAGMTFLRQLLLLILLADSDDKVTGVFIRVAKSPKLKLLRESLKLFFHHFLLKNVSKLPDFSEEKLKLLKHRISIAEKALTGSPDVFSF